MKQHWSLTLVRGLALAMTLVASRAAAQDARDALVARAFNEYDAARRLQILRSALNPMAGPPRGSWPVGIQLLAQTLIEDHRDSLAGVWLRWAIRLAPDLQPDTVQFLPRVVSAYFDAREFVRRSRSMTDTLAGTTWMWQSTDGGEQDGALQVSASTSPLRVEIQGIGLVAPGTRTVLSPGSYGISASTSTGDTMFVTREVLPGVTTILDFRTRPVTASLAPPVVADSARPPNDVRVRPRRRRFPVWIAVVGAAGAAGAAFLGGKHDGGNPPPTTGGITLTFPRP